MFRIAPRLLRFIRIARPFLKDRKRLTRVLKVADQQVALWRHSVANHIPIIIQPRPRQLSIAVTARCNLRCIGCRYERDFMLGEQLPLALVRGCLDDARVAGINTVRLYGGEPLLHPDLPKMVEHSVGLGFNTYITTNGILLHDRMKDLYNAGLRSVSIGFYGIGDDYDNYVQRHGQFARLDASLSATRELYGEDVELQLNYVITRQSCTLKAVREAWAFAERHNMYFHIDMVSYSVPFLADSTNQMLQFKPGDTDSIATVCGELIRLKCRHPERFLHSIQFLRSLPDWLQKRNGMRVPCDAYEMLWVGADGTVQLCDTHFRLGNLHHARLNEIVYQDEHKRACMEAFLLNCPNCMCKADGRILKHGPSRQLYSRTRGTNRARR